MTSEEKEKWTKLQNEILEKGFDCTNILKYDFESLKNDNEKFIFAYVLTRPSCADDTILSNVSMNYIEQDKYLTLNSGVDYDTTILMDNNVPYELRIKAIKDLSNLKIYIIS